MTKTAGMDPRAAAFAAERFSAYYARAGVEAPSRLGRREFGFMFFDAGFVARHMGFPSRAELEAYLVDRAPAHAYYSTAYYERPDGPTMRDKGWMGADLIFDLDCDHLPGAQERLRAGKVSFPDLLRQVREEAVKIVEDFLLPDFGFDLKSIHIAFSGGRGYHIHVVDPGVAGLGAAERREIVDYVTARGLEPGALLLQEAFRKDPVSGRTTQTLRLPAASEAGWRGKTTSALVRRLRALQTAPRDEAVGLLVKMPGVKGAKTARNLLERLSPEKLALIEQGYVDQVRELASRDLVEALVRSAVVESLNMGTVSESGAKGETDEPVTTDVKRLIRLPGSLHGGSGLRVTRLDLDGLKRFDPFRDAVALGDDPVPLEFVKKGGVDLKGVSHRFEPGPGELPEHAAVFAVLRGFAVPAASAVPAGSAGSAGSAGAKSKM